MHIYQGRPAQNVLERLPDRRPTPLAPFGGKIMARFINFDQVSMVTEGKDGRLRIYFRDYTFEMNEKEKEEIKDILASLVNNENKNWWYID